MKIFSWNVNGIRAVQSKGALNDFINTQQPDAIGFQETKFQEAQMIEQDFDNFYPDYQKFYSYAEKKGYSGTAIWLKKSIKIYQTLHNFPETILDKYDLSDNFGDAASEGRICAVELSDLWLVTVYTPNSKGKLERIPLREKWDKAFLEFCEMLKKGDLSATKPVIFCGDLNVAHEEIDLANPKQNKGKHGFTEEERSGFSNYIQTGFVDIFRNRNIGVEKAYTWWSYYAKSRERNVGWRIDYFIIDKILSERVVDVNIHPDILGSDHCPISLEIV